MNQDIKKEWVAALRSGDYKQTEGCLKHDGFCCLGVLCDIHSKKTGREWALIPDNLGYQNSYNGETALLPAVVGIWAELESSFGAKVVIDGVHLDLTSHNDNGATFEEIATAIEEQL